MWSWRVGRWVGVCGGVLLAAACGSSKGGSTGATGAGGNGGASAGASGVGGSSGAGVPPDGTPCTYTSSNCDPGCLYDCGYDPDCVCICCPEETLNGVYCGGACEASCGPATSGGATSGAGAGGSASGSSGSGPSSSSTGGAPSGSSGAGASSSASSSSSGTGGGSAGCAQVDGQFGCCDGSTLRYCNSAAVGVVAMACTGGTVCGWDAAHGWYGCVSPPAGADPSNTHPEACSAIAACLGGPGTACQYDNDCCQVDKLGDVCLASPIQQCAAKCSTSSECASNCCVALSSGGGACVSGGNYTCLP